MKTSAGLPGDADIEFDLTGNVYVPGSREHIGSLTQGRRAVTNRRVWALVRIDHFLEDLYMQGDKCENPAEVLVTVTAIHELEAEAREHEARLSATRESHQTEYFVAETKSFDDSGESPVVFVGIRSFTPGESVRRDQVVVGPVWPSLAEAERSLSLKKLPDSAVGSFQVARRRPRKMRTSA